MVMLARLSARSVAHNDRRHALAWHIGQLRRRHEFDCFLLGLRSRTGQECNTREDPAAISAAPLQNSDRLISWPPSTTHPRPELIARQIRDGVQTRRHKPRSGR